MIQDGVEREQIDLAPLSFEELTELMAAPLVPGALRQCPYIISLYICYVILYYITLHYIILYCSILYNIMTYYNIFSLSISLSLSNKHIYIYIYMYIYIYIYIYIFMYIHTRLADRRVEAVCSSVIKRRW